jgi:hypothetical protein
MAGSNFLSKLGIFQNPNEAINERIINGAIS